MSPTTYSNISKYDNWLIYKLDKDTIVVKFRPNKKSGYVNWFYIKNSTIKGAGKGLFAARTFKEHILIGKYDGDVFNIPQNKTNLSKMHYTLEIYDKNKGKILLNGRYGKLGWVQFANDGKEKNNCIFTPGGYLKTCKFIKKNQEIFVNYGDNYWKDFANNNYTINMNKILPINLTLN
jgi:hypothetical protein